MSASRPIRIGVLETGKVDPKLIGRHGGYDSMFRDFLGKADPGFEVVFRDVVDGHDVPDDPAEADAWLVTGSKHGVYEDHVWIPPLADFLRRAHQDDVPLVGICFGHQMLAEALGGKVEKSERGWGCGVHSYNIGQPMPWMDSDADLALHVMHQDQIVRLPDGAVTLAGSDFCPHAVVSYGPTSMSMQAHPEFERPYEADLISLRRDDPIPVDIADDGLRSLDNAAENQRTAGWVGKFLNASLNRN